MSFRRAFDRSFNDGLVATDAKAPGKGEPAAPLLAIGTLQWGTTWFDENVINKRGGCMTETTSREIFQGATKAGVQLWDTAEGYGGGTSEKRLGRLLQEQKKLSQNGKGASHEGSTENATDNNSNIIIMTKFLPAAWRYSHGCFESAVRGSCKRLGVDCIPVYLLHSPMHWRPLEFWVEAAAICKRKGLIEALGLSNCNADQVERAVKAGKEFGVDVVVNQVHYSLLSYGSESLTKMQEACVKNNVAIVGFSTIGQGLLTDKLTTESFEGNRPAKMMHIGWDELSPLRATLKIIADKHDVTMARVALKWCIQHNVIPLVGCRKPSQLEDSLGCLSDTWEISDADMKALDEAALNRSTFDGPKWRRSFFVTLFGVVMVVCRTMDFLGFGMVKTASM